MLRLTQPSKPPQTKMRLSAEQQNQIHQIVQTHLGDEVTVALYGSRIDDSKKGGDVDLYIETPYRVSLIQRATLKQALEDALLLPVDVLIRKTSQPPTPFQAIAKGQAQRLETVR